MSLPPDDVSPVLTEANAHRPGTASGRDALTWWECLSGALLFFFVPVYRAGDAVLAYHSRISAAFQLVVIAGLAIAMALLFWILARLASRRASLAALAAMLPLVWFASGFADSLWRKALGAVLIAACLIAAHKWPHRSRGFVREVLAIALFPAAWLWLRALWFALLVYPPGAFADIAPLPPASITTPAHRVVWIVLDEMSERATEDSVAAGAMPNWRALVAESISADDAHAPANKTEVSLPALTTGALVADTEKRGPRKLSIRFASGRTVSWSDADTIFSWAAKVGFISSIVGWYHPYGRLFGGDTARCVWAPLPLQFGMRVEAAGAGPAADLENTLRMELSYVPLARRTGLLKLRRLEWENHATILATLWPAAIAEAADKSRALVFIHMPIPHPPGIYDPIGKRVDTAGVHSYADNLQLADIFIGDLRTAMARSGAWQSTVLLITSDHTWRKSEWRDDPAWTSADEKTPVDQRVPFVLRFPEAAGHAARIEAPVENLVSRELVQDILTGRLETGADAQAWLMAKGSHR